MRNLLQNRSISNIIVRENDLAVLHYENVETVGEIEDILTNMAYISAGSVSEKWHKGWGSRSLVR